MPLFPMIVTSLKILNPSMHGKDNTRIRMQFMMQAFFLDILNESMQLERMFSKTAITVEKLAKVMKRKKRLPHKMPPFILTKTLGKVMNMRLGPEFTSMPKLKQAGKIIMPDIMATKVSRAQIFKPSLARVKVFDM